MKARGVSRIAIAAISFLAAIILITTLVPAPVSADGVVTLYNAPPTFVSLKIQDVESRIVVTVEVSDYNGWEDIYQLRINVTDVYGNIIESAVYSQYVTNESEERIDEFRDIRGGVLLPHESDVERFPYRPPAGGGWGPDWFNATYQRMTFIFKPFSGYKIIVTAYDRKMVSCQNVLPFSSQYRVPPVIDNPAVPIGISMIVAAVAAIVMYMHRKNNNKLAQIAEEKLGG